MTGVQTCALPIYGLLRALEEMRYWLIGCRKLIIETGAKYIFGMLNNPNSGPNATINRWIKKIFYFATQVW